MKNESPVGLATYLALLPGALAAVVWVIAFALNGGDTTEATNLTAAITIGLSAAFAGGLRQWRAVSGGTDPAIITGGRPLPTGAEDDELA